MRRLCAALLTFYDRYAWLWRVRCTPVLCDGTTERMHPRSTQSLSHFLPQSRAPPKR